MPWGTLETPRYLNTKVGSRLLVDGWWRYARKIHYTSGCAHGAVMGFDLRLRFFPALLLCDVLRRHDPSSRAPRHRALQEEIRSRLGIAIPKRSRTFSSRRCCNQLLRKQTLDATTQGHRIRGPCGFILMFPKSLASPACPWDIFHPAGACLVLSSTPVLEEKK